MKVVIVGGVAGGASAAARLRRLNENAQIVIFERTGYMSYANCGLPYYIGGEIGDEEELTLQTPEAFWDRFRVDVRVHHEVTKINRERKTVTVKNLENGKTYEEGYDKLILSPGAKPVKPDMKGLDSPLIFTLRTVEDTLGIKSFIDSRKPKSALVVGGGFIGMEMCENLTALGISVSLIGRSDHLFPPFDFDMACALHAEAERHGVTLLLDTEVNAFETKDEKITAFTDNGAISADMALLSIGVSPESSLAADAGLKLGLKNSIYVNNSLQTSDPDIYAVGDAIEVSHIVTAKKALISLAGPANKQGRIAADNICGINSEYKGSLGSSVLKFFNLTAASAGLNEEAAKRAGYDFEKIILSPMSHASYYPGGSAMTVKVIFERKTQKLLGAQIVGYDGVDKRIDVIATAMRAGLKGSELAELELAYAPPYSSAKDPVNMVGFMIENISNGLVKQFHYEDIDALVNNKSVFLLDSRTPGEYARGHIDGFVNIPVDSIRERLDEIPKHKPVYVICQSGLRSYLTCRILSENGYNCYNFSGGYRFYSTVKHGKEQAKRTFSCGMNN